jgi:transcription antitermination factor NusG
MEYDSNTEALWYALRVRTKCEKVVVGALRQRDIVNFLPLYKTKTQWSDRVKTSFVPLFPGYVFAKLNGLELHSVGRVIDCMYVVGRGNVPEALEESEVDAVKRLVAEGAGVGPWPFCTAGQTVEVTRGPLAGLRGVLLRSAGKDRLIISLPILQRSVATEIESYFVRPIAEAYPRTGAESPSAGVAMKIARPHPLGGFLPAPPYR